MEWAENVFISELLVEQGRTIFQEIFFKITPVRRGEGI